MAKQRRIGPQWPPRDITDATNWTGCESVAKQIHGLIGGTVRRIVPGPGYEGLMLGEYRGTNPGWSYHEVVFKDGRVYDAFTGYEGIPAEDYKALWSSTDALALGF